jgi:hypothetical protein
LQCTNLTNPACGCIDYRWTQPTLHAFITQAEQLGVEELDVWRMDLDIPPGAVPAIPPWFIAELKRFLSYGGGLPPLPPPPPPPPPASPPSYLGGYIYGTREAARCENRPPFEPCSYTGDRFTKTGSGQT